MAKKKATKKANSNQVVVKITGGALPSNLCYRAGQVLAAARASLVGVALAVENNGASSEKDRRVKGALIAMQGVIQEFPLTKGTVLPVQKELGKLSGKSTSKAIKDVVHRASGVLATLEGKARVGCNVH